MTQKNCSICKSKLISKVHDEIREFKNDVYRCKNCETVFLNDYKSINYKEDYGTKLFDSSWNVDKILSERSKSLKDVIKKINDIIEKKNCNDILELGPGYGSSLIDLKKKIKQKIFSV